MNPASTAVLVACTVAALVLGTILWFQTALRPVSSDPVTKLVVIRPGKIKDVAGALEASGVVRHATAFRLMAKARMALEGEHPKAGAYDLSPSMSAEEIWQRICAGQVAKRKVTFPEGFTVAQMAERLQERLQLPTADFLSAARGSRVSRQLGFRLPAGLLEGYLFPSTYEFPVAGDAGQMVGTMLATFQTVFAQPYAEEISRRKLSLHEIVTLASLVEREARKPEERALIAGVLQNRLDRGMRLQCDATVQYALGGHRSRLLYRDLKVSSPYNTYLHAGLPPGPICNPGLACLRAALRPAKTDKLFYVARADGSHVFTRTYEEHQQAIRQVRGR
ncbi:MAG: endolytic transglycosylase MltG [Armatimonadetes bacterium]|nr:endolytic transglycosylase MltG [Armatimonadota bacterium]